jgi:hypothetical protein
MSDAPPAEARVLKRRSILKSSSTPELANAYDYCMVFKLEGEPGSLKQSDVAKYVVKKMLDAKFELFSYLSVQRDELIVLIRCPVSLFSVSFWFFFSFLSYSKGSCDERIC